MTDVPAGAAPADVTAEIARAGALLRAARQQQGLHLAALAAAIKVTPAKLEALEAGRLHELPDATFARALALTVCRVLKIDAAPVLALLPGTRATTLERVDSGLNTPFRERPGRVDPSELVPWRHPVLWLVALLLVAAAAFVLLPSAPRLAALAPPADSASLPVMPPSSPLLTPAPAEAGAVPDAASAPLLADGAASAAPLAGKASASVPAPTGAASAAPAALAAPLRASEPALVMGPGPAGAGDPLVLRATQATWIQLVDAAGQTLMARLVPAGETVNLNAVPPLRLRVGNVKGTEISFRGRPVDLAPATRDNIANLTLP